MFSRNGQYIINKYDEQGYFQKQLPSTSQKVTFKKGRQKFLNVNQQKFQISVLRDQIHNRCRNDELTYLRELQKQRQNVMLKQKRDWEIQQQNRQRYLKEIQSLRKQRDSIDKVKKQGVGGQHNLFKKVQLKQGPNAKYEFSLEPNRRQRNKQYQEFVWVKKVREQRMKLYQNMQNYRTERDSNASSSRSSDESSKSKKARVGAKRVKTPIKALNFNNNQQSIKNRKKFLSSRGSIQSEVQPPYRQRKSPSVNPEFINHFQSKHRNNRFKQSEHSSYY